MKPLARLGSALILLFICFPVHGQFLKNLKKKVEQRVEQTVTEKIADKAAKEAGKTLDNLMEGNMGGNSPFPVGTEQVSMDEIPDSYDFEWAYELQIQTGNKEQQAMDMTYYLKEGAPYWGARIEQGMSLFMVFDVERMLSVIFMESEGNNFVSATKIPEESMEGEAFEDYEGYELREVPGKKILGYDCKGYEMEDENYKFTVYTTFDTDVSLTDMYKKSEQFPQNFNMEWIKQEDKTGMLMEMLMEDKSKKNETTRMTCTRLEKEAYSIKKADYNSLAGM
jgi:hypothetical protein